MTLATFNSAAHNKPALVRDILQPSLLPRLYAQTRVDVRWRRRPGLARAAAAETLTCCLCAVRVQERLIRHVEMGPFKQKVDDGLEVRSAAFECLHTLISTCLDRIDLGEFLGHVAVGLRDNMDIRLQCHLILCQLAELVPESLWQRTRRGVAARSRGAPDAAAAAGLDEIMVLLRETIFAKPKQEAVQQDMEKNAELVRSALRTVAYFTKIPDSGTSASFNALLSAVRADAQLLPKFNAALQELSTQRRLTMPRKRTLSSEASNMDLG